MDKYEEKAYTGIDSNPASEEKGVQKTMPSRTEGKSYSWSLLDDRGTWAVRVRVIDETGRVIHKSKSTGFKVKDRTKRKALEIAPTIAKQIAASYTETGRKAKQLFKHYVAEWLKDKDATVRANTAKSYHDYAKVHILPVLGDYEVGEITWRELQRFCNRLLTNHSKNSVKKVFIVIRGALDDAVRDGAISMNPESLVKWPKAEKVEKARALTDAEVEAVQSAAEKAGEPLRAAVTLALVYGLRRSEACGLRWIDIDFKKRTLNIRHTVTQNGNVLIEDDHTKTRGSRRTLALVESTIPYLKELRAKQLASGSIDKVVAWPDGRVVRPDGITRMFQTMIKNAGIDRVRFHDLRHTAATLLAKKGLPPKQLQAFLGHDDISMTLGVYVHADPTAATDAANMMDSILNSNTSCTETCTGSTIFAIGE